MGWGSGSDIYAVVADELIKLVLPAAAKLAVLVPLAEHLNGEDWDTQDEAVEQFRRDPAVVAALYQATDGRSFGPMHRGSITYEDGAWVLTCHECRRELGREPADLDQPEQATGSHNQLLYRWGDHDLPVHHSTYEIGEWMLLTGTGARP